MTHHHIAWIHRYSEHTDSDYRYSTRDSAHRAVTYVKVRKKHAKATKPRKPTPNDRLSVLLCSTRQQRLGASANHQEAKLERQGANSSKRYRRAWRPSAEAQKRLRARCRRARCHKDPAAPPSVRRATRSCSRPQCSFDPSDQAPPSVRLPSRISCTCESARMAASHLDAGELQRKKAVGGRVGRAGHAGGEIRVGEQVYGARLGVRGGAEDCARCAGRPCLGPPRWRGGPVLNSTEGAGLDGRPSATVVSLLAANDFLASQ